MVVSSLLREVSLADLGVLEGHQQSITPHVQVFVSASSKDTDLSSFRLFSLIRVSFLILYFIDSKLPAETLRFDEVECQLQQS